MFVVWLVIGLVAWSFAEYAVHRWLLHGVFKKQHGHHHRVPLAPTGVSYGVPAFIIAASLWVAAFFDVLPFALGVSAGYVIYVTLHELSHRRVHVGWHDAHHQHYSCNYGVTTPLFDFVFGTYRRG